MKKIITYKYLVFGVFFALYLALFLQFPIQSYLKISMVNVYALGLENEIDSETESESDAIFNSIEKEIEYLEQANLFLLSHYSSSTIIDKLKLSNCTEFFNKIPVPPPEKLNY